MKKPNGFDAFKTPEELVGYMEAHAETPRALCLAMHIVLLMYLAGYSLRYITRDDECPVGTICFDASGLGSFHSLHEFSTKDLCMWARKRIHNNEFKADWLDQFVTDTGIHFDA